MELSVFQIVLISVLSMSASIIGALGTTYGWYTLGRPLVASFFVGLIIGDVSTAIYLGSAVQIVYIALVTPSGLVAADLDAVSYIGIPLAIAMVKGAGFDPAGPEAQALAVSLCVAIGTIGTILFYGTSMANLGWQEIGWKAFKARDYKLLEIVTFFASLVSHFVIRFIPTFIILRFGLPYIADIQRLLPMDSVLMKTMFIAGTLLPAVGVAILLAMIVKKPFDFIVFAFGFLLARVLGINLIGAAIIGAFFGYLNYKFVYESYEANKERES